MRYLTGTRISSGKAHAEERRHAFTPMDLASMFRVKRAERMSISYADEL